LTGPNLSKVTGGTGNGLDSRVAVVDVANNPGPNGEVFNVNAIKPPTADSGVRIPLP
jgi:hypothetical protein